MDPNLANLLTATFMEEASAIESGSGSKATTSKSLSIRKTMLDWIKERWNRLELRHQQWEFHCHQASLLSESDLRYYAAGHGFNLQFAKACKRELGRRQ